jgi:hypothetical protein
MIFDEKSEKSPQTGSGSLSVTVSSRHVGPKPKWFSLTIFGEKIFKILETASGCISASANDIPAQAKLKWPAFDVFLENLKTYPGPEVVVSRYRQAINPQDHL